MTGRDIIINIHKKEKIRVNRDYEQYKLLFARAGKETILAIKGEELKGYVCYEKPKDLNEIVIYEYCGNPEAITDLIKFVF